MLLLQQRDLIEQSVRAAGFAAVAGIDLFDRRAPAFHVSRLSGVDLAERVVDVRQLVRGNVRERIPRGGPVRVVADDSQRFRRLFGLQR